MRTGNGSVPSTYRVTIEGRLSLRFASVFEGMALEPGDGETTLVGPVADQAALYGLLERLRNLNLVLLRLERAP